MSGTTKPGLWVMEGKWSKSVTDVRTVKPVLNALKDAGMARYALHPINDADDLVDALRDWSRYTSYGIGYVALHGSPGSVYIRDNELPLTELGEAISGAQLSDRVLHFGSCAVLDGDDSYRQELRASLGVRAICGFTKDVDWFPAMAFELILFEHLAYYSSPGVARRYLLQNYGEFAERLGFVMAIGR